MELKTFMDILRELSNQSAIQFMHNPELLEEEVAKLLNDRITN